MPGWIAAIALSISRHTLFHLFHGFHLTLSVTCSISTPLVHCYAPLLRCSPPLTPSFSAAFFVSLRRLLRRLPSLSLVTCHLRTPRLFYIRSSKKNWPIVRKYINEEQMQDLKRRLTAILFYERSYKSQFFIFLGSRFCLTFLSHNRNLTSAVEEHLPNFKSKRRIFELAISQKISLLCWFNRSRRWFWEEEGLTFYIRCDTVSEKLFTFKTRSWLMELRRGLMRRICNW